MKLRLLTFAAAFSAAASLGVANAAPINFGEEALPENGGERGLENGAIFTASNGERIRLTSGGIASDGSDKVPSPYLDGPSGGPQAGLGVCTLEAGVGSECEDSSEDNVTGDQSEFIELGFIDDDGSRLFTLLGITFKDRLHFDITDSSDLIQVSVDGGALMTMTFAEVAAAAMSGAYAGAETLRLAGVAIAEGGREFYINAVSDVPVPAALPLLLSGLAGLGFASRRKRGAESSL